MSRWGLEHGVDWALGSSSSQLDTGLTTLTSDEGTKAHNGGCTCPVNGNWVKTQVGLASRTL